MVVEDRCFQGSFYLVLLLQAAAAEISQLVSKGDTAMLICGNLQETETECESTTWTFTDISKATLELVTLGNVKENLKRRISLTENCSLLIPEVQAEDAGVYYCQQFMSGVKQPPDAPVYLGVVTLKAVRNVDEVRLSCCVLTYLDCSHQVTWLFKQVQVVESHDLKILRSSCSATVKMLTFHVYYRSRKEFLTCEIRNKSNQTVQFSFRPSGRVPATATTKAATATTGSTRRAEDSATLRDFWWVSIIAAVVFVAFVVIVVIILKRKRTKVNRMNNNDGQTRVTYSTPEMSPDTVDAEDSVSYAAIVIKSQGKAQGQRENSDNEGDGVIYATVKASPSYPSTLTVPTIQPLKHK